MQQADDQWRRRYEREAEKKRRLEETQRAMHQEIVHLRQLVGLNQSTPAAASQLQRHVPKHSRFPSLGSIEFFHHNQQQQHPHQQQPMAAPPPPLLASTATQKDLVPTTSRHSVLRAVGPDVMEGPNSPIGEEEFYDAIDAELDRLERMCPLRSLWCATDGVRHGLPLPLDPHTESQDIHEINSRGKQRLEFNLCISSMVLSTNVKG